MMPRSKTKISRTRRIGKQITANFGLSTRETKAGMSSSKNVFINDQIFIKSIIQLKGRSRGAGHKAPQHNGFRRCHNNGACNSAADDDTGVASASISVQAGL